mmetsp:Transcript_45433/g.105385  ORF Transcript_45433/g.105385 Transcript_45433/m.105385 type:complete len:254 (-) Transcript_45433:62-823(-)
MGSVDWEGVTGHSRTHDTEAERRPFKPQKSSDRSSGFTSQVAGLLADSIVEKAMEDKLSQEMAKGADGTVYDAKSNEWRDKTSEEEAQELDEKADKGNADDDDLEAIRARRMQKMKEEHAKRARYQELGHGSYDEIDQDGFLKAVTASPRAIVHFYHTNFEKCKIIDMHLLKCARKFMGTRFLKINAEKAPFFVEKLKVKTLPCIVVFVDGISKGRQLGFEGLAGDTFPTAQLAWKLQEHDGIEEEFGPEDEF